jgi:hypothetical protein
MAIIEKFKLDGARELYNALKEMEKETQVSILRRSARRAMIPMRDAIAINIAMKLDNMNARARAIYSRQIQLRTKFDKKKGSINVFVMPNVKSMQNEEKKRAWNEAISGIGNEYKPHTFTNFAYLAHFFETGVKPHVIKIKRKRANVRLRHPGFKGMPIFQDTFKAKANDAATRFITEVGKTLAREFKKRNKGK